MTTAVKGRESTEGVRVRVEPEACGFAAVVRVRPTGEGRFRVSVESGCDSVNHWIDALEPEETLALLRPAGAARFLAGALKALPHVTCPVPLGILRAVEVLAGAALPSVAVIRTESEHSKTT